MTLEELINQSNHKIRKEKDALVEVILRDQIVGNIDNIISLVQGHRETLGEDSNTFPDKLEALRRLLEERSEPVLKLTEAAIRDSLGALGGNTESSAPVQPEAEDSAVDDSDLDALLADGDDSPQSTESEEPATMDDDLDALLSDDGDDTGAATEDAPADVAAAEEANDIPAMEESTADDLADLLGEDSDGTDSADPSDIEEQLTATEAEPSDIPDDLDALLSDDAPAEMPEPAEADGAQETSEGAEEADLDSLLDDAEDSPVAESSSDEAMPDTTTAEDDLDALLSDSTDTAVTDEDEEVTADEASSPDAEDVDVDMDALLADSPEVEATFDPSAPDADAVTDAPGEPSEPSEANEVAEDALVEDGVVDATEDDLSALLDEADTEEAEAIDEPTESVQDVQPAADEDLDDLLTGGDDESNSTEDDLDALLSEEGTGGEEGEEGGMDDSAAPDAPSDAPSHESTEEAPAASDDVPADLAGVDSDAVDIDALLAGGTSVGGDAPAAETEAELAAQDSAVIVDTDAIKDAADAPEEPPEADSEEETEAASIAAADDAASLPSEGVDIDALLSEGAAIGASNDELDQTGMSAEVNDEPDSDTEEEIAHSEEEPPVEEEASEVEAVETAELDGMLSDDGVNADELDALLGDTPEAPPADVPSDAVSTPADMLDDAMVEEAPMDTLVLNDILTDAAVDEHNGESPQDASEGSGEPKHDTVDDLDELLSAETDTVDDMDEVPDVLDEDSSDGPNTGSSLDNLLVPRVPASASKAIAVEDTYDDELVVANDDAATAEAKAGAIADAFDAELDELFGDVEVSNTPTELPPKSDVDVPRESSALDEDELDSMFANAPSGPIDLSVPEEAQDLDASSSSSIDEDGATPPDTTGESVDLEAIIGEGVEVGVKPDMDTTELTAAADPASMTAEEEAAIEDNIDEVTPVDDHADDEYTDDELAPVDTNMIHDEVEFDDLMSEIEATESTVEPIEDQDDDHDLDALLENVSVDETNVESTDALADTVVDTQEPTDLLPNTYEDTVEPSTHDDTTPVDDLPLSQSSGSVPAEPNQDDIDTVDDEDLETVPEVTISSELETAETANGQSDQSDQEVVEVKALKESYRLTVLEDGKERTVMETEDKAIVKHKYLDMLRSHSQHDLKLQVIQREEVRLVKRNVQDIRVNLDIAF